MQRKFRAAGLVLMASVVFVSCKNKEGKENFEVSGVLTNSNAKMVYLEEIPVATMQRMIVDSAEVGKDGKYKLKTAAKEASVYNLRLDQNNFPLASVVNDAKKISLDASFNKENNQFAEKYEVKGSKGSQQMKDFMLNFNNDLQKIYLLSRKGDSLHNLKAPDSLLAPIAEEHQQITTKLKSFILDEIAKSENPAQTMFELGYYQSTANNPAFGLQALSNEEVTSIVNGLAAKYPGHSGVLLVKQSLDGQAAQLGGGAWVGKQAPEIALPGINGKEIKLSSYKGKYVLVDFWASWCGPCRAENPNVVDAYNQFKDKNFTILGVSLDEEKDKWLKAIKADQLAWAHVSDLKGWKSMVVPLYQFGGIPYNVLIDPDGKVIAESLRGAELEMKLEEVLK
jgi:peroxiredoxin